PRACLNWPSEKGERTRPGTGPRFFLYTRATCLEPVRGVRKQVAQALGEGWASWASSFVSPPILGDGPGAGDELFAPAASLSWLGADRLRNLRFGYELPQSALRRLQLGGEVPQPALGDGDALPSQPLHQDAQLFDALSEAGALHPEVGEAQDR